MASGMGLTTRSNASYGPRLEVAVSRVEYFFFFFLEVACGVSVGKARLEPGRNRARNERTRRNHARSPNAV